MSAFVYVNINGVDCELIIDSGAAVTVISTSLWENIPILQRPELKKPSGKVRLEAANSELINVIGVAVFNITIDNLHFKWEAFVADISDDGILGYLYHHDCNLAARHGLTISGKAVDCKLRGLPEDVKKVTLVDDVTLPGYSECIIQAGAKTLNEIYAPAMFEPIFFNEEEEDKYDGIIFGRSLMDLKRKDIGLPIRVLNTTPDELKLRAGMKIGYLHKVDAVQEIEDAEILR